MRWLAPLLLLVLLPATGRASGFAAARFGGETGHVTTDNPTALYYNPAGIALGEGTQLFADGVLALRGATWDHALAATDRADPPEATGANSGRARLFNVFGAPMVGATTRLGRLALGGAIFVPFGGRSSWQRNPAAATAFPLAADGVQRWHSTEGALTFVYFTAGAAYRLGSLSLGVAANLIRSSVKNSMAKNPTGNGEPDTTREGRTDLDVAGTQGSFAAGLAWEPLPGRLWLGASYQAQPGLGPMILRGHLATRFDGGATRFPVTFTQALPDIVRLGARYRPTPTLELRLHGDRTRWSVLQSQCVSLDRGPCAVLPSGADATTDGSTIQNLRRRWQDTLGLHAGVSLWPGTSRTLELFLGAGLESGAVPDSTLDPGLFDADNLSLAAGTRLQLSPALSVQLSYTHVAYADRDNVGASQLAAAELPTRRPDGGGRYTLWLGVFGLSVALRL